MLKKIAIKNVATYDESGMVVDNLNKVNFIYGANGSGKTTISKFIDNCNKEEYKDCEIEWSDNIEIKTLVYNKEFRDRNFGKSDIAGIFTLGQATKEEIEKIQEKKTKLTDIKNEMVQKKKTITKQNETLQTEEDSFKEVIWRDIFKKNETMFKEAFKGFMTKQRFKDKVLDVYKSSNGTTLKKEELEEKAKTIFDDEPEKIDMITEIQYGKIKTIEEDEIWNAKIVGKQDINISKLIQKLNNGDWINTGRKYIQESDICPFCQQHTITNEFKKNISEFFDEEFEKQIDTLNYAKNQYDTIASEILERAKTSFDKEKSMKAQSKLEVDKLSIYIESLNVQIESNKELIEKKCKEPSISVDIVKLKSIIESINKLIINANCKIRENNRIVDNYHSEKSKLVDNIWSYLVTENKTIIDKYEKKKNGLKKGISMIEEKYKDLQNQQTTLDVEIKRDSKNVTSVQPSVDEINRLLKAYGFENFMIVPSTTTANHYQIQRQDGSLAESTLSEGEVTFITFLYFLQLAKGSMDDQQITEDRILVVDDPISSLDSSVLFIVSSLLKEIIIDIQSNKGSIKQIIVLTHNVYFHKEISFFGNGNEARKDTCYWMLRKKGNVTNIECFRRENPISSSYELLWKELKEVNKNSGITIQNIMRRILENYFKILGRFKDDDLILKFDDVESQRICRSLLCWINDGSHCMPDDLFVECPMDTIEKYQDVFKDIFYNMGQIEHYNMMMGIKRGA
ncbi:AAA family ATPase [Clostridium ganghwense]|uniref:AAA family ATPase n=1 Tax=Clostridium ganghwense TaxID=312089 RepID=A0ABT4CS66_9CLOT|nr:AAA family ATPase [Clostridium ganghwense]MCY6371763.1 AAA family ATPase [Clostridium ganghwense]